jgi:radical SAM protein with 4Fe4S-binding SPASM domain
MQNNWLKRLFSFERPQPAPPVKPGLYHVMHEDEDGVARFHLRVDNDGSGMLIANAMAAAKLTTSGAVIAKGILEDQSEAQIIQTLQQSFSGTDAAMLRADVAKVRTLIEQLKAPGDTYPVFNLEDAATSPYSSELIAPLQASVPLAEPESIVPILDRLWEVCIPHVTLLAPDGFQPAHLVRAVERAEDLGMIAGVRSRATNLQREGLLPDLRMAGVDHITFLYAAGDPALHDALCGEGDHAAADIVMAWLEENQISAIAEVPLVQSTLDVLAGTVTLLLDKGADNFSFVAYPAPDDAVAETEGVFTRDGMAQVATTVEEIANSAQARFIWNPPVQRDPSRSLKDQILQGPRSSGDVAVRVEPTGEVIPPRGPYHSAGNLLSDSWASIWDDPVFRDYRERVEAPTRCDICPGLAICAADCPRDPKGWAQPA